MSGIAGIVNLDGAPVDRNLLRSMTHSLSPHGVDAQNVWIDGHVGFGHAILRTTPESADEHQPCALNGSIWITADGRIDAREDLRRELMAAGQIPAPGSPDAQLILCAYAAWGDRCVEHLLGDFAFALWDGPRRTLLCARDHFGVRPFYYAQTPHALVFSNGLNAVRLHPAVTRQLDEAAVADFLVFGYSLDPGRPSFSDVRRLPAGHVLMASEAGLAVRQYWQLPFEDEILYRRPGEYLEHFRSLIDMAVQDRLRTARVSVMMSGGLDSPTVAAVAHTLLSEAGLPRGVHAHTIVFDRIVVDEERKYSQIAADAIGISIRHHPFDDFGFPPPELEPPGYPPEPRPILDWSRAIAVHRPAAADARVILKCEGADPLFMATAAAPQRWIDDGRYWRLAKEYVWLLWNRRQIPYFGVRTMLRTAIGRVPGPFGQPFPDWLNPALEARLHLRDRWRADRAIVDARPGFELAHPFWSFLFEHWDPVSMGLLADVRYPYLDLRLVRWALRVPQVPWALEKSLLRLAMSPSLPRQILRRRKAPLAGNPWAQVLPPAGSSWWEPYMRPAPELTEFVDVSKANAALARSLADAQATNAHSGIDLLRSSLRPLSLNLWLQRVAHGNLR